MAVETSVESEYFSNPTKEQVDSLKSAMERNDNTERNGDTDRGTESETSLTLSGPTKENIENKDIVNNSDDNEKSISYVDNNGDTKSFTPREWEDEWNKNKVESQWQNLGRDKNDMYDKYSGLDFYGKDASKETSSIGVPKSSYLSGLYAKDENGNYKYQDKLNARNEARKAKQVDAPAPLQKAVDGAKKMYKNTIGKVVDRVSAYKDDISDKARNSSDERVRESIDNAKLLANSNITTSQPNKKVTLEYDATKLPATESSYKPEVQMKVPGVEKPMTKTQVEETKAKLTKELGDFEASYEINPSKTLKSLYYDTEMYKEQESGLVGLSYYDKEKVLEGDDGTKLPTGALTTESGYRVDIDIKPKGDLSKDNLLYNAFMIGPGRQVGTATIYLEDGSTKTYTLHEAKDSQYITVQDDKKKRLGDISMSNTVPSFMHTMSRIFDKIPGQGLYRSSPTVAEALKSYDNTVSTTKAKISNLENAEVDMNQLSTEWDRAVENTMPKTIVTGDNNDIGKEIITKSDDLEKMMNQFTKPEDKKVAAEWYNTYTPKINEAIENAKADPVGNAGKLADVLEDAQKALAPYANEDFTNFNRSVNNYVGAVAGTYFIETQLYDRGVTADNSKENFVDRIITAYKSDEMTFGQKALYVLGFGSKESETDKGVMQLRNLAEQSLGRSSGLSPNFKGAVMSSLMAQKADNKDTIGRAIKDVLTTGGIATIDAMSGFNPIVVGITSIYAAVKGLERYLTERSGKQRNDDNEKRLESIKNDNDQKAMPTTKTEDIYNSVMRGTAQDIKNASLGTGEILAGIATNNLAIISHGVYTLSQIKSLHNEVQEFVGKENLQAIENIMPKAEDSENSESSSETKKKKVNELDEVVKDGDKQDGLDGLNLPPLSDELKWLIEQPFMKNYEY